MFGQDYSVRRTVLTRALLNVASFRCNWYSSIKRA